MHASLTASWIARTLGLPGPVETEFLAVITDSRKAAPGSLFVALPGETFDGHDFIGAAIERGASGILAREDRLPASAPPGVLFFPVKDSLAAYGELGAAWRGRFSLPVVLVAGSNGKTTTKELLAALLRGKFKQVLRTEGSQNGFVGIPLTLLALRPEHQAAVIEVGIDEPGAMDRHVRAVAPTASVLTLVGPEHLEKLIDLDTVAREEGISLSAVSARGGSIAVNLDDPRIAPHFRASRGRKLGYTLGGEPATDILAGRISMDRRSLDVTGGELAAAESFGLPLAGAHNATNLLSAIAVARLLGLTPDEMRAGLSTFSAAPGRSQLRDFRNGTRMICDYYNSQPASLRAGLELLRELAGPAGPHARPSWACLADMLELGPREEAFHREAAEWILSLGIDHVALYGSRMSWLEDELRKRKYAGFLRRFSSHAEVAACLAREVAPGSVVLLKGSRGMKMEECLGPLEKAWAST